MKPGFVHSCFLLIYLRLSKPIYFPSRYHRKDKSKNLVYNSVKRSFVNNSINCTVSFTYIYNIYIYVFFSADFVLESTNEFFRSTVSHASPNQRNFSSFFFLISVSHIFFLSPPHLFFFCFDFVSKLYKAVSRDTDRVTFALAV